MTNTFHDKQTIPNGGIHTVVAYIYADSTARESATGFDSDDLYKVAVQTNNNSFWILLTTAPTWQQINSGTGSLQTLKETLALGNLTDGYNIDVSTGDSVNFGGNPSVSGVINLSNNSGLYFKDFAGATDLTLIKSDGYNNVLIGDASVAAIYLGTVKWDSNPTLGAAQDGYVATFVNADGKIEWKPSGATLGGDVTGAAGSNTVIKIRNTSLGTSVGTVGASQDGYALTWNNSASEWRPTPVLTSVTLGGDVTGSSSANTVVKLQNRTLSSSAPTDGYVITWNAGTSTWVTTGHDILLGTYGFAGSSLAITPNATGATNATVITLNTANYSGLTSAYRAVSLTTTGTYSHVAGSYSNTSMVRLRQFTVAGDSATAAFTGVQANLAIQGPPIQGTNATLTNPVSLWIEGTGSLAIGSAPARTGSVRMVAGQNINYRNAGDTVDVSFAAFGTDLTIGDSTNGGNMIYNAGTGSAFHQFNIGGTTEYQADSSKFDFKSNTLVNPLNIQFPGSGVSTMTDGYLRFPNGTVLAQSRTQDGLTEVHIVRFDNTNKLFFGDSVGLVSTIMSVATGGSHSWRINNSEIAKMDGTTLDLDSQHLTFTGSGTPSTDGYINFDRRAQPLIHIRNYDNTGTTSLMSLGGDFATFMDMNLGDGTSKGINTIYLASKTQIIDYINSTNVQVVDAGKRALLESTSPPTSGTTSYVGEFVEGGQLKSMSPRGIKTTLSY